MRLEFQEGSILEEVWKKGTVLDDWYAVEIDLWRLCHFNMEVCGDLDLQEDLAFLLRLAKALYEQSRTCCIQMELVA